MTNYYIPTTNIDIDIQSITMSVGFSYWISPMINNTFLVPFYQFTKHGFDTYYFDFTFISDYPEQFINTTFGNYNKIVTISPLTSDFNISFLFAISKNSTTSRFEFMKQISKIVKSSRIAKIESALSTILLNFAYYQDLLGAASTDVY